MDELAMKMAELLDIGVDSALELYPVFRQQFMFYYVLNTISEFIGVFLIFLFLLSIGLLIYYFIELECLDEADEIKVQGYIKLDLQVVFSLLVFDVVLMIAKVIFSPDIVLIQELFNKS